MIKEIVRKKFHEDSAVRWILVGLYRSGPLFIFRIFRSLHLSYRLTGKFPSLCVRAAKNQQVRVIRSLSSKVNLFGVIRFDSWEGISTPVSIRLSEKSTLTVLGSLSIGPGVNIVVEKDATLEFGGKSQSSGSGITCNSIIMVEKFIKIGRDCIISWGTYITDSDHHAIAEKKRYEPVFIGDGVWISHDVSILKGSVIPEGCIVGAKALVLAGDFEKNCLIGGVPAKVLKKNVVWTR
jgi:acetyltransferase-like isoleucine patch superfamily enzyme